MKFQYCVLFIGCMSGLPLNLLVNILDIWGLFYLFAKVTVAPPMAAWYIPMNKPMIILRQLEIIHTVHVTVFSSCKWTLLSL